MRELEEHRNAQFEVWRAAGGLEVQASEESEASSSKEVQKYPVGRPAGGKAVKKKLG